MATSAATPKESEPLKPIATTRFTTDTHAQFNRFGAAKGTHWYGTPKKAPQTIDMGRGAIVIEMNNTENKIEGIGIIVTDGYHRRQPIYHEPNWCRHTYRREAWLSPAELQEEMGKKLWEALHKYLFTSIRNQKRWNGITGWKCHDDELTDMLLRLREELRLRMDTARAQLIADPAVVAPAVTAAVEPKMPR